MLKSLSVWGKLRLVIAARVWFAYWRLVHVFTHRRQTFMCADCAEKASDALERVCVQKKITNG